uniref:SPNS lysolipid transporter 3, sphingosine-1-phosphate (putative) n=1 Tax=Takifugu rubripes TaxID=31033 RepID=A0A674PP68_TAKRU
LSDGTAALLQTVFICSFLLLAPVFGYLGDRYNRKYIMIAGLIMWTLTSFCCSFITESYFWALMLLRALVGIGEASQLHTMLPPSSQTSLLGILFSIVCVFSGLGFIIGAGVASQTGDWHWAFRINPIFGLVGIALLFFFCPNPPRGAAETQGEGVRQQSSYLEDVKYLLKIKSYMWSTLGITASTFNLGALAFWMPTFLSRARVFQGLHCQDGSCLSTDSYGFGVVTIVTGVLGGSIGTLLSRSFRDRLPHVDPLICAVGLLASVPCLIASIFTASTSIATVFAFLGQALVAMNWAVMADILLYIVIPNRRSTAEALQVMFIHLLGDCGSPYIVGAISDAIYSSNPETSAWSFHSLQYSITICPAVGFIGGLFYLVAAFYINDDRKAVLQFLEGRFAAQL